MLWSFSLEVCNRLGQRALHWGGAEEDNAFRDFLFPARKNCCAAYKLIAKVVFLTSFATCCCNT